MTTLTHVTSRSLWAAFAWAAIANMTAQADDKPRFARIEDRSFPSEFDRSEQRYVVMIPAGISLDKEVKILVTLHGHGSDRWQFVRQTRGECRAARDVAAAHNMLLVSPDYRAKTSWMGPAAEADLVQIIRMLKKQYRVTRVILSGGSMGGTGALTFAALHPRLVDGVVALNGTANLIEYKRFQEAIAKSFGGSKEQIPAEYRKRSAEFFSDRFTMPLAATTGGNDDIVPPGSVLRLIAEVRNHNQNVLSIHRQQGGHSTTYEDTKRALEFIVMAMAATK